MALYRCGGGSNWKPMTTSKTGAITIPISSYSADSGVHLWDKPIRHITNAVFRGSIDYSTVDGGATLYLIKNDANRTQVAIASGSVSGGPSIYNFNSSFQTDEKTQYIGYRIVGNKNKDRGSEFRLSFSINNYEQKK